MDLGGSNIQLRSVQSPTERWRKEWLTWSMAIADFMQPVTFEMNFEGEKNSHKRQ